MRLSDASRRGAPAWRRLKWPALVAGLIVVVLASTGFPAGAAGFGFAHAHFGFGRAPWHGSGFGRGPWHGSVPRFRPGRVQTGGPFRAPGGARIGGPHHPGAQDQYNRAERSAPGAKWGRGEGQYGRGFSQHPRDARMRDGRGPSAGLRNAGPHFPGGRNLGAIAARNGIFRQGFFVPPVDERRFVTDEVVLDVPSTLSEEKLVGLAHRHRLTRVGSVSFGLTGHTLYRWRVDDGRPVADVIRDLQAEADISAAQPNFTFTLQDPGRGAEPREGDPAQYAVAKLHLSEAHRLATGDHVIVAVIDSAIDTAQPELAGVIAGSFDAVGGAAKPDGHGTAMAGAIAAHGRLIGAAPRAMLFAVRAFGETPSGEQATTISIVRALDWAIAHGARVVNMSFAGPADPALETALAKAHEKGAVLVAAAGNAGPRSPPLYPAADPNVIAVTATDASDKLFAKANRGSHIAIAAPGVDVLVPAPNAATQLTSGTSVAAAEVSGIVALMLERNRMLTPDQARTVIMATAKPLGPSTRDNDFGAGLANAWQAVKAAASQSAEHTGARPMSP